MKKIGFTMAEILIVLAIIGVISSLTLPTIMTKNKNSQISTKLARVYQLLNTANEQYLMDEEQEDLSNLNSNTYLPAIVKCIKGANLDTVEEDTDVKGKKKTTTTLYLPVGASVEVTNFPTLYSASGTFLGVLCPIKVNLTNGISDVNGRDTFYFYVDKSGALLPIGSIHLSTQYNCDANTPSSTTKNNYGCAGKIFDNGWKLPKTYQIPKS